jgi:hypothetical protein
MDFGMMDTSFSKNMVSRKTGQLQRVRKAAMVGSIVALFLLKLVGCALMKPAADPIGAVKELAHLVGTLNEIKTTSDIKQSFVLRSSELLFPSRLTASAETLPTLTDEQQEEVSQFLSGRIQGLYALSANFVNRHDAYKSVLVAPPQFRRVKFLITGKPEAIVDTTGTVFIDVRTVQAILRSVIIQWEKNGGISGSSNPFALLVGFDSEDFGPDGPTMFPTEEVKAIDQFNAYRRLVKEAPPSSELGFWYRLLTKSPESHTIEQTFGKGFFNEMADRAAAALEEQMREMVMLAAARHAQEIFESAVDFLIAHEIAHQVFGHASTRAAAQVGDDVACAVWQQQELLADEFAALVLAQRQFTEARAPTIRETRKGFEQKGDGYMPSVQGRSLVLSTAYRIAGFSDELVHKPCRYPSTRERMDKVNTVFKCSDASLRKGLYLEGLHRGDLLRSKEEARLSEVLAAAELSPKEAEAFDSAQLSRVMGIVQTMARDRFTGRL